MSGLRHAATALLLALALVGAGTGSSASAPKPAAAGQHPRTPLEHLVVMLQQGHSFDNYFGTRAGVDGLPGHVCLPQPGRRSCARPRAITGSPHVAFVDGSAAQRTAVDAGRMDGFVRAQDVHGHAASMVMGHYRDRTLPVLGDLADRGALFDHWFSGTDGNAVANDLFAVAARAPRHVVGVPPHGWRGVPLIFDRLQAAGVSWRIYVEDYRPGVTVRTAGPGELRDGQVARVPVLATARFLRGAGLGSHVAPLQRYYADLAHHDLPAVTFVVTTQHTEQPPRNPVTDQPVVRAVANALIASPAWSHAAFLLTYDTAGGWYDHVRPPTVNGATLGLRVPTVLLSPYVRPGRVVHETYDAAAVLRLIEQNWDLAPLTRRDRDAASLLPVFSFRHGGRQGALIDVAASRPPVAQPDSWVLYGGYLAALAAGLGCIVAVTRRSSARPREST